MAFSLPIPLISGCVVRCRPVAVLKMTDESGDDAKILAVPISKLCKQWDKITGPEDMSPQLLDQIAHFFEHYKDLDEGKWVRVDGWGDTEAAKEELRLAVKLYQEAPEKPNF